MESAFESWIGRPAVVHFALGRIKLSLLGIVLKEQTDTLLLRAHYGPDVKIGKTAVLAIEEARTRSTESLSWPFVNGPMQRMEILGNVTQTTKSVRKWSFIPLMTPSPNRGRREYQHGVDRIVRTGLTGR